MLTKKEKTIPFGFGEFSTKLSPWTKHHKKISTHVKRVYEDGEMIEAKNPLLKEIIRKNEDVLLEKKVELYNFDNGSKRSAVDYYLPLDNQNYEEGTLPYYSVGATNTKQTFYIRLRFQIEENHFVLEHSFRSEGSYALNFRHFLEGTNAIEEVIDEIIYRKEPIECVGIQKNEDGTYLILVANEVYAPDSFEIEKYELLNSLVGVELYKFDMVIE